MKQSGALKRIVEYVQAHPGCLRRDILAAIKCDDEHNAMPTYCAKVGAIFAAGPRGSTRYYPTAEQAAGADAAIRAQVKAERQRKKRNACIVDNLRKRARRIAAGSKPTNTRPGSMIVELPSGATLHPNVRVTIAPPMRDRWAA